MDEEQPKAATEGSAEDKANDAEAQGAEEKLGEGGIRALRAEREARSDAEKRATAAEAKVQAAEDAKLSDIQKARKDAEDSNARVAALESQNAQLSALAAYPIPEGYRDLVTGTDAESYLASAKKVSELFARAEGRIQLPAPVPGSGSRVGNSGAVGSSLATGRDLYESKHPKKS